MSNRLEEHNIEPVAASTFSQAENDAVAEPTQLHPVGAFRYTNAFRVFDKYLRGVAQHVAMQMARRTPRSGILRNFSGERLGEICGWSRDAVLDAIPEIVNAGLITRKRSRDGYTYTWTAKAYTDLQTNEIVPSQQFGRQDVYTDVHATLVRVYLNARVKAYSLFPQLACSKRAIDISPQVFASIAPEIIFLAEQHRDDCDDFAEVLEAQTGRIIGAFFANPGKTSQSYPKGYLRETKHPLYELARDIEAIMSALLLADASKKGATERKPDMREERAQAREHYGAGAAMVLAALQRGNAGGAGRGAAA